MQLTAGAATHQGRLVDLGHRGLRVALRGAADEALAGAMVEIQLRLDQRDARWLLLSGRVVSVAGPLVAIEIDAAPADFDAAVDGALTASLQHDRVLSVLLVDADVERRGRIAAGFGKLGAVLAVGTPLEAIHRLGASSFEPDVIVIADSLPAGTADELRAFVAREHPHATLIRVGESVQGPSADTIWLSASADAGELVARILALVGRT